MIETIPPVECPTSPRAAPPPPFAIALLCIVALAIPIHIAAPDPGDPAQFRLGADPDRVQAGDRIKIIVRANIADEWRLPPLGEGAVAQSTRIAFGLPDGWRAEGGITGPIPRRDDTPSEGLPVEFHAGAVEFTQDVIIPRDFPPGEAAITARIEWMAFSDGENAFRTPLSEARLEVRINVIEPAPHATTPAPFLGFPAPASPGDDAVVVWTARFEPPEVLPGAETRLILEGVIKPRWHMYSMTQPPGGPKQTTLEADEAPGIEPLADFSGPDPDIVHDPAFDMMVESHSGVVVFERPYRVATAAVPGPIQVTGVLNAMFCDEATCLPPRNYPVEAVLIIAGPTPGDDPGFPASPAPSPVAPPVVESVPPEVVLSPGTVVGTMTVDEWMLVQSQGLLLFALFAMSQGLIALFTPCAFPMIPITVSFFTKQTGRSSWSAVGQSLLFCASIIASFMALGILLSLVLGATGAARFAANPWVNMFIGALFIVFALSLFGAFEIQIPTGWLNRLGVAGGGGRGGIGIIGMGFVFTVTSFTCTVAFVGLVLVAATRGDWFWPAVGMLFFSAAFSFPFFFLALFPQFLARLPKRGGWLNSVMIVMGLLEFAFAFKFFSNVDLARGWGIFTRPVLLAVWTSVALVTGFYLLGAFRMAKDSPNQGLGPGRLISSLLFLSFGLYLSRGLFGLPINPFIDSYLPPQDYRAVVADASNPAFATPHAYDRLPWITDDYDRALEEARRQNRPLFIDFTGIYCVDCRLMEIEMFPRPEIRHLLSQFVLAKLYTDTGKPKADEYQRMQVERFGSAAPPLYVILRPDDEGVIAKSSGMDRNPLRFADFLQSGLPPEE